MDKFSEWRMKLAHELSQRNASILHAYPDYRCFYGSSSSVSQSVAWNKSTPCIFRLNSEG